MLALLLTLLLAGLALLALLASSLTLLPCRLALLATATTTANSNLLRCHLLRSNNLRLRRRRRRGWRLIRVALSVSCKVMTLRARNRRLHFLIILDIFIHSGGGHV